MSQHFARKTSAGPIAPAHGPLGLAGWFLVVASAAALACGSGAPVSEPADAANERRPNLVIVTLDTTRADHLGFHGYFRDTSPELDALASEAIVFEHAWMPIATTLPTHLSLFTGTHPLEHGVLANTTHGGERFVPSSGLRSFAVFAREAGHAAGAFVSAAPLKRGSGIEHGFDVFDQPEKKHRAGDETTARALAWLDGQREDRPFLLWVHYYDAHYPFEAPPAYRLFESDESLEAYLSERRFAASSPRPLVGTVDETRAAVNAYDAELRFQDAMLGRLLGALRARSDWSRTAILVVGDHGEGLGQHGEAAHGGVWQEQLHAPLVMHVPGAPAAREREPISAHDVLPTFLAELARHGWELSGLAGFQEQASGIDALASEVPPRPVLGQDTGRKLGVGHFQQEDYRRTIAYQGFKYLRTDHVGGTRSEALFDLGLDPFELDDVKRRHPELLAKLRAELDREVAEREARGRELRGGGEIETVPVDPQALAELCALGYLECEDGAPVSQP